MKAIIVRIDSAYLQREESQPTTTAFTYRGNQLCLECATDLFVADIVQIFGLETQDSADSYEGPIQAYMELMLQPTTPDESARCDRCKGDFTTIGGLE